MDIHLLRNNLLRRLLFPALSHLGAFVKKSLHHLGSQSPHSTSRYPLPHLPLPPAAVSGCHPVKCALDASPLTLGTPPVNFLSFPRETLPPVL